MAVRDIPLPPLSGTPGEVSKATQIRAAAFARWATYQEWVPGHYPRRKSQPGRVQEIVRDIDRIAQRASEVASAASWIAARKMQGDDWIIDATIVLNCWGTPRDRWVSAREWLETNVHPRMLLRSGALDPLSMQHAPETKSALAS